MRRQIEYSFENLHRQSIDAMIRAAYGFIVPDRPDSAGPTRAATASAVPAYQPPRERARSRVQEAMCRQAHPQRITHPKKMLVIGVRQCGSGNTPSRPETHDFPAAVG